jgi:DNA primase
MGKISPISAKYIVHAIIEIEGIVDRPDVIGAIFGQTEGLLGSELELRELQRSGRIGRIEVNVETRAGKTRGTIIIPSSLDKAETSIIGAALEIIQRIGPCNARIKVEKIEDVRVSKRNFVISRAKELLKNLMDGVLPDSQELADEVAYSVRVMEVTKYGKDRLPAGPAIDDSDEIIIVEGRADVLNLLKHGIKNVVAMNGTSVPSTIVDLCKQKVVTAFVDGDRGGDLIVKELTEVTDLDYVSKAPDGKEVEEITKKEIHKALRSRVSAEQAKLEISGREGRKGAKEPNLKPRIKKVEKKIKITKEERDRFKIMLEDLIGTRGAYILDKELNILGKVPITELQTTVKSLDSGMYAIVFDGVVDSELVKIAEKSNVRFLVAMTTRVKPESTQVAILTEEDL